MPLFSDSPSRTLALPDADATAALGARLGRIVGVGDAVLLFGDLGAGKTTLARGLIEAWTGETDAPSPTYTLMQWYDGAAGALAHLDLYRLASHADLDEIGLEDALETAVCVIEWAERLRFAPAHRIDVRLEPAGAGREARLNAFGRLRERLHDF